jgi:hypothetical protein
LRGPALAAIKGIASTKSSYFAAVKTLKNRFGKEHHIINNHMQSLLNLSEPDHFGIFQIELKLTSMVWRHLVNPHPHLEIF